jgi:hypothetical protein
MTIGNHKYENQNRLKINLFTTRPVSGYIK